MPETIKIPDVPDDTKEYFETYKDKDGLTWRSVQQLRDEPMQSASVRDRPKSQFQTAYDRVMDQAELATDGGYDTLHDGPRQATVYYWLNPETGAALYHTGVNTEESIPFFPDDATAQDYLEKRAATGDEDQYAGLSLYKARTRKVGDAVDVLTDQAGFDDFLPDGGRPKTAAPDTVWFWYNPSLESIVQEEIGPYDVRGVFATREDADQFLDWYAEEYGVVDTSHLELYSAEVSREGFGRTFLDEGANQTDEPPEQVDFDAFHP